MSTKRLPLRRIAGFTLVELLVVISIITLLIAILLPALKNARDSAQSIACESNLRQLGIAFYTYAQDHDDQLPPVKSYADWSQPPWVLAVSDYLNMAEEMQKLMDNNKLAAIGDTFLHCPAFQPYPSSPTNHISYGANYPGVMSYSVPLPGYEGRVAYTGGAALHKIPPKVFLAADQRLYANIWWRAYILNPAPSGYWPLNTDYDGDGVKDSNTGELSDTGPYNAFSPRHPNHTGNFLLADGSVHNINVKDWASDKDNLWGADDNSYKSSTR